MQTRTVDELIGAAAVTVVGADSVHAAASRMHQHGLSAVLVLDGESRPQAILTASDLIAALAQGLDPALATAGEVATGPAPTVTAGTAIRDALDVVLRSGVDIVTLVDAAGRIVGIVTLAAMLHACDGGVADAVGDDPEADRLRRLSEALGEQYRRNELILHSAMDGFLLADDSGQILDVNPAYCEMVGLGREQLLGSNITEREALLSPAEVAEKIAVMQRAGGARFESQHRRADGGVMDLDVSIFVMHSAGGPPLFSAFVRDISAAKQQLALLRASERKFRALTEIAPVGVLLNDPDGRCTYVNETAARMTGLGVNGCLDWGWVEAVHPDDREWVAARWTEALAGGDPFEAEYRFRHPDGTVVWCVGQKRALRDDAGDVAGYLGTLTDITAIKTTAERLQQVLDAEFDGVFVHQDSAVVFANQAALQMFEFDSVAAARGVDVLDLVDARYRGLAARAVRRILRRGEPEGRFEIEVWNAPRNRRFPVEIANTSIPWGHRIAVLSIVRDIGEQRLAEVALRRREEQLAQLVEASQLITADLDEPQIVRLLVEQARRLVDARAGAVGLYRDGAMVFSEYSADARCTAIDLSFAPGYGVPGHVLATRESYLSNDAEHDPHVIPEIRAALDFHKLVDTPILDRDGMLLGCFEIHDPIDGRDFDVQDVEMLRALAAVVSGALENARLIKELVEAEARLRATVEATPVATVITRYADGQPLFANQRVRELFRLDTEQALQVSAPQMYEEPQRRQQLLDALRDGGTVRDFELEVRRIDGSRFSALVAAARVRFEGEDAIISSFVDQTERRAAARALAASEQRYRQLVEVSPDAMVVHEEGTIVFANPAAATMLGASSVEALIGIRLLDFIDPTSRPAAARRTALLQRERGRVPPVEYRLMRAGGGTVQAQVSAIATDFEGRPVILSILRDMTEHRRLEEQFRQAQKMESVGTLAGGIAHDFNNMLGGMLGQLYLLRGHVAGDQQALDRIAGIERQGQRAAGMIQQMLTFARKGPTDLRDLRLDDLVRDTLKLHRIAIPENIELVQRIANQALWAHGDGVMLQQVLLNLLHNARDALADVPDPWIEVGLKIVASDATPAQWSRGDALLLEVGDNGNGMPADVVERIFEPFFTTKEVGRGTGLGLAMAFGAIDTHGGLITVDSQPRRGSTFRVYLPLPEQRGSDAVPVASAPVGGQGEAILVADDDVALLEVAAETLQALGYRVIRAHDGADAVEQFLAHRDDIALVVIDVVMPNLGGVEAARRMRERSPNLPVIFHTGYGHEAHLAPSEEDGATALLMKPVRVEHLAATVARMLAG